MKLMAKYICCGFLVLSFSHSVYADRFVRLNNDQTDILTVDAKEITSIEVKQNQRQSRKNGRLKSSIEYSKIHRNQIFKAGPSSMFRTPSDISRLASDGSIVEIEAGEYSGDVTVWNQNNITIRGVGGIVHLKANGKLSQRKAIWVIKGNNVVIEHIEFSGAKAPSRNGAGIRMEGSNLTLRHCHFHDNEMGILTGKNPTSEILIENSEFNHNTVDYKTHQSLGHNIYIGEIAKFTLRGSYIHDAETGHNVKSRAHENYILYNRITDEKLGSSYLLDLPNGGNAYIIGNIFHQNSNNDNFTLLSFAAERNRDNVLSFMYVVNNTLVNSAKDSIFIRNHGVGSTILVNNLFVGPGKMIQKADEQGRYDGSQGNNSHLLEADFINIDGFDYRLKPSMQQLINQGVAPGVAKNGFMLNPGYQYVHPRATQLRPVHGKLEIGAFEFVP